MTTTVNLSEFRNNISDYINRIIYRNDSFLLKKGKTIVAKVVFYDENKESLTRDRISKYAGSLNDKETRAIVRNMKKFREKFALISKK